MNDRKMDQSLLEQLRRRERIADEVRTGIRELECGDCLELDDAGLGELALGIAKEGRKELNHTT